MVYLNDVGQATAYVNSLMKVDTAPVKEGCDHVSQKLSVLEAGMRVQAELAAGDAWPPLATATRALRMLNGAVVAAKHADEMDFDDQNNLLDEAMKVKQKHCRHSKAEAKFQGQADAKFTTQEMATQHIFEELGASVTALSEKTDAMEASLKEANTCSRLDTKDQMAQTDSSRLETKDRMAQTEQKAPSTIGVQTHLIGGTGCNHQLKFQIQKSGSDKSSQTCITASPDSELQHNQLE